MVKSAVIDSDKYFLKIFKIIYSCEQLFVIQIAIDNQLDSLGGLGQIT